MNGITRGSAFKSGIRIGGVRGLNTPFTNYPAFDNGYPGIPTGVSYPFILPAPTSSAGNLWPTAVITAGVIPITPGPGVTVDTTTFPGYTAYDFGQARTINITNNIGEALTLTISGWDYYGVKVVEVFVVGASNNVVDTKKAIRWLHTIQADRGNPASAIQLSVSNSFGFPYRVIDRTYCFPVFKGVWSYVDADDNSHLDQEETITVADNTFPATASTGDVRGTYSFTSGFESPNGTPLCFRILNPYMDPYFMINNGLTTETRLVYGVPQYDTGWL